VKRERLLDPGWLRLLQPGRELTAAHRLQIDLWTVVAGLIGLLLGVRMVQAGAAPWLALPGGALGLCLVVRVGLSAILGGSGRVVRSLYVPSGRTTPSRPAYSLAESLAVRGRHLEAIAEYRRAAERERDDPEPLIRIARIQRDRLDRPQEALESLRAALARSRPASSTSLLVRREMVELYCGALEEPRRAMPQLARIAAEHDASPSARWARRRLEEMKRQLAVEEAGATSPEPG